MIHCHFCGRLLALGDDPENPIFTFEPVIAQPVADGMIASCDAGCAADELCDKLPDGKLRPKVDKFPTAKQLGDFKKKVKAESKPDAIKRLMDKRPDALDAVKQVDPVEFDAEQERRKPVPAPEPVLIVDTATKKRRKDTV